MAKFNFVIMETKQRENLQLLSIAFKKRADNQTAKINDEISEIKEKVIRYAVVMDKALATTNKKKYERHYINSATKRINYLETESSAKQVRKTIHKLNYFWNHPMRIES